ncbi:MAG: DegT/DnrJ/EryC1/StrS family aminotransferase [Nitrospiraceae bacterium]|nr:DegT/DnrJ/EryC1/StrS family aminotransferase [Nitrospiraceae bacterium]
MAGNFFFYKGRVALYAILKSLGVREGDEVILPGFTCVVVPNAVSYLEAKPRYVDIDPGTYNIDPGKIAENITGRTRAIIAQHTFGIPAKMDDIIEIAKKNALPVIEDSCHAIGSKYKGRQAGTFGDAAFFSSQWSKPVTTGLGGWATANKPEIRQNLERICRSLPRPSFWDSLLLRAQYFIYAALLRPSLFWLAQDAYRKLSKYGFAIGSSTDDELSCRMPAGYAKGMSDWQKKIISEKLALIADVIEHRRWAASRYRKLLPQAGFEPPELPDDCETVFLRYPLRVNNKKKVLESARRSRIEIGDWFLSPVHPNTSGWGDIAYEKGMCPHGERACEETVNLPTHMRIGDREIEKTIELLSSLNN